VASTESKQDKSKTQSTRKDPESLATEFSLDDILASLPFEGLKTVEEKKELSVAARANPFEDLKKGAQNLAVEANAGRNALAWEEKEGWR
jgi:hypothetical protein